MPIVSVRLCVNLTGNDTGKSSEKSGRSILLPPKLDTKIQSSKYFYTFLHRMPYIEVVAIN